MYNYIKGIITEIAEAAITVDVAGVGYEIHTPSPAAFTSGAAVTVYCRLIVREDDMRLFGFKTTADRALFDLLCGVSGLGPKTALGVLGGLTAERLVAAVATSDTAAISSVKGIGKKTAERIVLELKDKVAGEMSVEIGGAQPAVKSTVHDDAVTALLSLGYTRHEAATLIGAVYREGLAVDRLVYLALKNA